MKRATWYLTYVGECPVCGRDKSYKVAQYTPPPPKEQRYIPLSYFETYDHCDG